MKCLVRFDQDGFRCERAFLHLANARNGAAELDFAFVEVLLELGGTPVEANVDPRCYVVQ